MNESEDNKLELIYCTHCGSPMGRLEDGSRCGLMCPRCKEEFLVTLKEDAVTQRRFRRGKRPEAVSV